jgi:Fic family protein
MPWLSCLRRPPRSERRRTRRSRTQRQAKARLRPLLEEALIRGEFERREIARVTDLPERAARRVLNDLTSTGLLASDTPKGALRLPVDALEMLFPRLLPET